MDNESNYRSGLVRISTTLSIIILLGIVAFSVVIGFQCSRQSEQLFSTLQSYGAPTPRLPYWQVEAYWKQTWSAWPGEDHIGPTTHTFYWAVQPDSTAVDSLFKPELPGRWRLAKIVRTTLLKPGRRIEEPQPDKDAPVSLPELK